MADTFRQHCPWLLLVENSPAEKDGDHNNTNVVIYPIFHFGNITENNLNELFNPYIVKEVSYLFVYFSNFDEFEL